MNPHRRLAVAILITTVGLSAPRVAAEDVSAPTPVADSLKSEVDQPLAEEAAETILSEIDVTASYGIDRSEPVATGALSSEEVLALPRLGNDLLRGIRAIPGVTAREVTAQFNVRGGLVRDAIIRIDGLEIYEPYHVKDFDNGVFSIIDPDVIGSLELISGGFPAEYGDKMAGVLDLTTARASSDLSGQIGISISSLWAGASSSLGAEDETRWRVSARHGVIEFLNGDEEEQDEVRRASGPSYRDFIGRLEHSFSPANVLAVSALLSSDSFERGPCAEWGFSPMDHR